jgi:(p)ppGpp synthase/HD superfamily hydrolase
MSTSTKQQFSYIAHLLGVAAIVLKNGRDEDKAIVPLFHGAAYCQSS